MVYGRKSNSGRILHMITRGDAVAAEAGQSLLWFLETEPGGETRAVSAVASAVTETGVYFQSIYRSFGDVYLTKDDASLLIAS